MTVMSDDLFCIGEPSDGYLHRERNTTREKRELVVTVVLAEGRDVRAFIDNKRGQSCCEEEYSCWCQPHRRDLPEFLCSVERAAEAECVFWNG
jgi:hypothetical protein